LSHFTYTVKKNKWDPLFVEVHKWYEIMEEYLKINKN
jgi:hypothetical protein